jgi:hypothetical protein
LMHMAMVMPMSAIGVSEPAAHIALTGIIGWLVAVTVCRAPVITRSSVIRRGHAAAQKNNCDESKRNKYSLSAHDISPENSHRRAIFVT